MGGARGFIYGCILLRIGQLPDLSPEINAVYMKLGPVIRRPRFISPTRRQATAGPALSRPLIASAFDASRRYQSMFALGGKADIEI